jgi:hypothetical protein
MVKFPKDAFHRDRWFDKVTVAFEYAIAKKWARANPLKLRDDRRSTVGEMMPPKKADKSLN